MLTCRIMLTSRVYAASAVMQHLLENLSAVEAATLVHKSEEVQCCGTCVY